MIPNAEARLVSSSPIVQSAEFGISFADSAHIMNILRAQLYTDKVLAVLREYSSNAWDAHRDAGLPDLPIKVTMPTIMEPVLSIRDFGLGLSPDQVFKVYTQYGASTKRNSDTAVGMLGIGSKSAFAYSDSFTIVSHNGGVQRTYIAVLDTSEKGMVNLLDEQPTEETGVEIRIAVQVQDINEFHRKARELFKYFVPRPIINIDLPDLPEAQATLKHGVIYGEGEGWVAVMGCVSYHVDLEQLQGFGADSYGTATEEVADFLNRLHGALYFNIGDVQVSASREELKYGPETNKMLVDKFNALVEEYVAQALDAIANGGFNPWERRVRAQSLRLMHLPVPKDVKGMMAGSVSIEGKKHPSFTVLQSKVPVSKITIDRRTRIILADDKRTKRGFRLTSDDFLIHTPLPYDWALVEKELTALLDEVDLQGIPVVKLSTLPWEKPTRDASGKTINAKHKMNLFKFLPNACFARPWSAAWEPVSRVPTPEDVYVVISDFQVKGYDLGQAMRQDRKLLKNFGTSTDIELFGYKTTAKKPVDVSTLLGTDYDVWRKKMVLGLVTPAIVLELEQYAWEAGSVFSSGYYRNAEEEDAKFAKIIAKMEPLLGPTHPIVEMLKNQIAANQHFRNNKDRYEALTMLHERLAEYNDDCTWSEPHWRILDKYPLYRATSRDINDLYGEYAEAWVQYIKYIDSLP